MPAVDRRTWEGAALPPGLCLVRLLVAAAAAAPALAIPAPVALFTFQEARAPYYSTGLERYALLDGNASRPIGTRAARGAPFGARAALFPPAGVPHNNSARLYAPRAAAPGITSRIAGPNATVSLVAWVQLLAGVAGGPLVAGAWDEFGVEGGRTGARQYALFINLAACRSAPTFNGGAAAHVSPVGGPTPGSAYCETAACDPRALAPGAWACLANTYDGADIRAYVNGTLVANGARNPFPLAGGIYDAEAVGGFGAEFGVGLNRVNATADGARDGYAWANRFEGLLGGVAVYNESLSAADVAAACSMGAGFEWLAAAGGVGGGV